MSSVRVLPWTYCKMGASRPGTAASAIWFDLLRLYSVGLNRTLNGDWPAGGIEITWRSIRYCPLRCRSLASRRTRNSYTRFANCVKSAFFKPCGVRLDGLVAVGSAVGGVGALTPVAPAAARAISG